MSFTTNAEHVNRAKAPSAQYRKGDFLTGLSTTALEDFESLLIASPCPARTVLFAEKQPAAGVTMVLEGEVKLSMNSGRRLNIRIAKTGEMLGLSSTISESPYEMTAETLYPTKIAHLGAETFFRFLGRHPEVYQMVFREMMRNFDAVCAQLRTMGLSPSVPRRLARLSLGWSELGENGEDLVHCRLAFTHEEIGEFIGTTREAVCRMLRMLRHRRLVVQQGRTLTIPNREALEALAACG